MRGNNPAWLVVISTEDHVSNGIRCGGMIRRKATSGSLLAIVSPVVVKDVISKLRETFDYIIFGGDEILEKHLEMRDALLCQALKFSSFSKIIVVDSSVMNINELELMDSYDIVITQTGEWKIVALSPNVSKWKTIMEVLEKSSVRMSPDDFINVVAAHFGGNLKLLDSYAPDLAGFETAANMEKMGTFELDPDTKTWVAIVGMSCRFPGANSVEEYWEILKNGLNASSSPSKERVLLCNLGPNVQANYLKCPIDQFDAQFFGMAPSEAAFTDVQARFLLEVSWEAFEDAGVNLDKLRGSSTGIFHGSWINDYKDYLNNVLPSDQEFIRKYIGNSFGSSAAKLSFVYGFTGPNISTDSGCSSSFIAVELACKSLLEGECPLAVATGANVILQFDTMSKLVWAEDGICKTFDVSGNGYGRAEGVAAVVLKRYSDAIRDNDRIHGIIRGSASTQEGLSSSFASPTVESEAMAMKNALLKSGVKPEQVSYLEAHATGTGVGDPIEAAAIVKAYSCSRTTPLWIGSGKTNIGHTESCSGLAALIKVVLALKHELIPPHINLNQLNPKVNFEKVPGKIPTEAVSWKRSSGQPRIAGVSNFGITGTDVHMIIQEAPKPQKMDSLEKKNGAPVHLLALSAKTEAALNQLTNSYIELLQTNNFDKNEADTLANMAYTLNARRTHHFRSRKVAIGRTKAELIASLQQPTTNNFGQQQPKTIKICMFVSNETLKFPATRSSYYSLYSTSQVFNKQMNKCDRISRTLLDFGVLDYLNSEQEDDRKISEKEQAIYSFSVAFSLFKLWESWGVKPNLVVAHGFGELAGKVAADLLTIEDVFKLIAVSTSCDKNLMKEKNHETTEGGIPYITLQSDEIELEALNLAGINYGCQICIHVGLGVSVFVQNDSKITHLPRTTAIGSNLEAAERPWFPLISTLGDLYQSGYNIDWEGFYGPNQHQFQLVSLPHYPFQRKSHWFKKDAARPKEIAPESIHPFLGVHFTTAVTSSDETTYQNWFPPATRGYLVDHAIGNEVIFPAAGYLEMALAAQHFEQGDDDDQKAMAIENFMVHHPLHLQMGENKTIQTIYNPTASTSIYGLELKPKGTSRKEMRNKWKMYASCHTTQVEDKTFKTEIDIEALKAKLESGPNSVSKFYDQWANLGLQFGPRFQSLQKVYQSQDETLTQLVNIPETEGGDYICHPLLIDAMLQCFILAKEAKLTTLQVPVAIQKFICISRPRSVADNELYVYCKNSPAETVYLLDSKNSVVAIMHKPVLKKTTVDAVLKAAGVNKEASEPGKFEIYWKPTPSSSQPASFLVLEEMEDYTDSLSFSSLLEYFEERKNFSRREKQLDDNINKLVSLYVLKALYELGWTPNLHKNIGLDELAGILKVVPAFVPAFCHLFSHVVQVAPKTLDETKREIEQILSEQTLNYPALQKVIHPCGTQLAAVFKGDVKIEDLFVTDDLSKLYAETGRFFKDGKRVATKVFTEVSREMWNRAGGQDSGKIMRILDVGTYPRKFVDEVLYTLDEDDIEYEYWLSSTSPSPEITAQANVKLVILDIEKDPLDQGLPLSHFDIIVAQNTLHSTKNCRKSLENLKLLTKLGGVLITEEMNRPIPEVDIVLGFSENYWSREDFDIRPSHCALDVDSWACLMEKVGFSSSHKIYHSGSKMGVIVSQLKGCQLDDGTGMSKRTQEKTWLLLCTKKNKILEDTTQRFLAKMQRNLVALTLNDAANGLVEELMQNHKEALEGILFIVDDDEIEADNYSILLKPLLSVSKCLMKFPWKASVPKLIVATKGCSPIASTLWGFVRTAQYEIPGLSTKLIELDPQCGIEERVRLLFDEVWRTNDDENEIQYRNGIRSARRLQKYELGQKRLEITVSESGDYCIELPASNLISDLKYSATNEQAQLRPDEVEIRVQNVSLNFRDVFSVLKPTPEFQKLGALGMDFAGTITSVGQNMKGEWRVGDAVFGFAKRQTVVRGLLRYSSNILARIPQKLTFSEAATFPAAFLTAWHCIVNVAKAKQGQTILIHAASGGVGLIAIQVASYLGLNIIGTAGCERKRNYLRHLGLQHVFGSRTLEFGSQIMKVTNGQGVDVVLNCLTGPGFKETSLEICKDGGYFVEISKLEIWQPQEVGKRRPKVSYKIVDITELEDSFLKSMLNDLVTLVEKGSLRPIPFTQFSASLIVDALTFLQKAKQIGKVILEMPSFDNLREELTEQLFNSRSTYLITGGKGAIGLAIAEWMVSQGAKYLVLLGRSPPNDKTLEIIKQLESKGAEILCLEVDISDYEQCKKVVDDIETTHNLPSLRGIHHCAGVLSDKMIVNQEWEDFEQVLAPKVKGAYNLHKLSIRKSLQFFVLHSSMSATLGNAGQSNYTAANAYMEALTEMRHKMGLPGLCVSWGQWNAGLGENLKMKAFHAFTTAQGIRALEQIFWENREQPCIAVGFIKIEELVKLRPLYEATLLEKLVAEDQNFKLGAETILKEIYVEERKVSFLEDYEKAEGLQAKELVVHKLVKDLLCDTLGVADQDIESDVLFSSMGMDSILNIEFYNKVQRHLGDVKLGFIDMDEYGTLTKMVDLINNALDVFAKDN